VNELEQLCITRYSGLLTSLLKFAVEQDLRFYILDQFDQQPEVIMSEGPALLATALRPHKLEGPPRKKMVQMLIKCGISPNGRLMGLPL
jgi:hypothetical protein